MARDLSFGFFSRETIYYFKNDNSFWPNELYILTKLIAKLEGINGKHYKQISRTKLSKSIQL